MGLWLWVLVGLMLGVGVLMVVAMGVAGNRVESIAPNNNEIPRAPVIETRSRPAPNYPQVESWRGLKQGRTQDQVRKLFGNPQKLSIYKGQETWEIYDDAEGSGIFTSRGARSGEWVKIKFDRDGKVVMFWHYEAEPKTPESASR